jgi:hypothetical protein
MKDISEFEKLFKVNIPVQEHFEYYIDTLKKSAFYAGIGIVVKEFEQYELDAEAEGYSSARSYKLDYALPKLKEYLLNTNAYSKFQSAALDNSKLRTKDELRNNDDTYLISIDFKSANYSALKTFDDSGELFGSWEELCIALDIHPTLAKSKSFRQFVFGNTNPGRLQKVQHQNIVTIVDKLIENHGFEDSDFVFISHDEFIIKLRPDHILAVNRINVLLSAIGTIIQNEGINMLTHYKVFKHEALGAGMCIQAQYQVKMGGLSEKYSLLFKVPGHKFFKYFKRYILQQPLDKRDLMFMSDGEIAVWAVDEDSVDEIIIPEGEMSMGEIESEYPYLVKKLKQEVPSMNDKQIRKAINVFLGLCNSCHNAESNCVCWRDE